MEGAKIEWFYSVAILIMNDVPICSILLFFRIKGLSFVGLGFGYYVLVCPCEYRVYIVVIKMPNYGVDCYRGVGQKGDGVLQSKHRGLFVLCSSQYLSSN